MAIKLDKEGKIIKVTPPEGEYFNVDMLERIVGGWPEPTKIGPTWVILNEDIEKVPENYNEIASNFFRVPVYGDILSVSAQELPPEWDLTTDYDTKWSIDDIDDGFIEALNNNLLSDPFSSPMSGYPNPFFSMQNQELFADYKKEEYFYNPNKPKDPQTSEENYQNFLRQSYDRIVECSSENFKDFVVYEDDMNIVRVKEGEDRLKTINQVLNILVEDEEYEKCAILRDILNKFETAE